MIMRQTFLSQETLTTYSKLKVTASLSRRVAYLVGTLVDGATGEKRYTPSFNLDQIEQKLSTVLASESETHVTLKQHLCSRCVEHFEQICE